jgi:hypothetical protein
MIHGTFTIANMLGADKTARAAEQLTAALSGFNEAAGRFCASLVEMMAAQARRATAEGDVRDDLDPVLISESIVGAMFGTRLLSNAISAIDTAEDAGVAGRVGETWGLLLPGVVTDASLEYFRQFLARESLRHSRPAPSSSDAAVPKAN